MVKDSFNILFKNSFIICLKINSLFSKRFIIIWLKIHSITILQNLFIIWLFVDIYYYY